MTKEQKEALLELLEDAQSTIEAWMGAAEELMDENDIQIVERLRLMREELSGLTPLRAPKKQGEDG